jgi:polysaccharide biosynthesis PFTS motif protein
MNLNYLNVTRRSYRSLAAQLRGARTLRRERRPFFVAELVSSLDVVNLGLEEEDFPKTLVGAYASEAEILLRQKLLSRYSEICCCVMQSIGNKKPVSISLPSAWVQHLSKDGISISPIKCQVALFLFSLKMILVGQAKFLVLLFQWRNQSLDSDGYVAFLWLNQNNLPSSGPRESYDLISWYKRSTIRTSNVKKILVQATVANDYKKSPDLIVAKSIFPRLKNLARYVKFVFDCVLAVFVATWGVIRGKWWYGVLLPETIDLLYIANTEEKDLAQDYFFSQSNWFYKPLWTYEVERQGKNVMLYHYSINHSALRLGENLWLPTSYGLRIMKWKTFVVWNVAQRDAIRIYCPSASFLVAGPIDFIDNSKITCKRSAKFSIAVFDINARRPSVYTGLGWAIAPYYSQDLVLKFFSDIMEVTGGNVRLLWKGKRKPQKKTLSKRFAVERDAIISKSFVTVDPDCSPRKLIEECDAVISIPYTSTAVIGKVMGKPSIYYDPSGSVESFPEITSVPTIRSKDLLFDWIQEIQQV